MSNTDPIKDLFQELIALREGKGIVKQAYTPVPPREFFTNPYFHGMESDEIYDFWVEEASDFIEGGYNELILNGSLGSGKTTVADLIAAYKTYEIFSYDSSNKYLGLPVMSDIYNIYFSTAKTQAARTGFKTLRNIFDASSWFETHNPRDKTIDSELRFKNGKFNILSGSTYGHAIGMNVWFFILDEADFFKKNGTGFDENYSVVTEMYQELVDRRISRFQKYGKDYSFSILISSASYQSSFVKKRIEDAANDPKIKVVNAVSYKIKPKGTYSEESFNVFIGNDTIEPCIVDTNQDLELLLKKLTRKEEIIEPLSVDQNISLMPGDIKLMFEHPPIDFRKAYDRNLPKSLMNHSGVYTARLGKLLQSNAIIKKCYDPKLLHPFTQRKIVLSTGDEMQLKDYFIPSLLEDIDKPHAIHIDQSAGSTGNDDAGISMVRYDGVQTIKDIMVKHYTQVFSLEIEPPPAPNKIKISKTREFIRYLYETLEVNIVMVTTDQYQSTDQRQIIEFDFGIPCSHQSVDKDDSAYLTWISVMQDEAISMYECPALEDQATQAIHDRRKHKVDHPKGGSIDILQSLVGALTNLVKLDLIYQTDDVLPQRKETAKDVKKDFNKQMQGGMKETTNIFKDIKRNRARDNFLKSVFD